MVGAFAGGGDDFIAALRPLRRLRACAASCVWHVARGSPFASHSRPFASARPVFRWRLLWVTVVSGGADLQCIGAHLYTSVRCPRLSRSLPSAVLQ